MDGFLLIDKESGKTSFDVVRELRRITGERKIGHSGTLDPLATGLLLVALGNATKLLEFLFLSSKEYEVVAHFGYSSDSYDADGEITEIDSKKTISKENVELCVKQNFLGQIEQVPPKYSALKVNGKRACDLMREGKDVDLASRSVDIFSFDLIEYEWPYISFRISCSTGTYIRSLLHDLGELLGVGAYVKELRRTKIGDFHVSEAVEVGDVNNKTEQLLIPVDVVAKLYEFEELDDKSYSILMKSGVLDGRFFENSDAFSFAFYRGRLLGVLKNNKDDNALRLAKRFL